MESIILGFRAGFTGEALENMLYEYGCQSRLIPITGYTRINVKIKGQEETDINGQGPEIPAQAQKELFSQLAHLREGDVLVLAGSIPNSLPEEMCIRDRHKHGKRHPGEPNHEPVPAPSAILEGHCFPIAQQQKSV